jgi:hypothetical protein
MGGSIVHAHGVPHTDLSPDRHVMTLETDQLVSDVDDIDLTMVLCGPGRAGYPARHPVMGKS